VKDVGEPCAGEPHARFDGEGLETEQELPRQPLTQPTSLAAAPRDTAWPDATAGRRTLGSLGEAALSCLGIGSELTWPPGTHPSVVRAVDLSIEPWSDWHHCHGRTANLV
jgi:hypothetical protein